jgi:hypothetical protein
LSAYLSIRLSTYLPTYLPMALQPFCCTLAAFQFLDLLHSQ